MLCFRVRFSKAEHRSTCCDPKQQQQCVCTYIWGVLCLIKIIVWLLGVPVCQLRCVVISWVFASGIRTEQNYAECISKLKSIRSHLPPLIFRGLRRVILQFGHLVLVLA